MLDLRKKVILSQIAMLKEELVGLGEGDADQTKKNIIIKSLRDLKQVWLELKEASVANKEAEELEALVHSTMELEETLENPAPVSKKAPNISNMEVEEIEGLDDVEVEVVEGLDDVEVPLLGFDSVPD